MRTGSLLASVAALALAAPDVVSAQSATPLTDPAVAPPPVATPAGTKQVYTAADFARFAPRTAFDMLVQVPGFDIRQGDQQERGLGQASENVLIAGQRIANKSGGAVAELQRISASNVERIEIVEAASLGIAGLSGQVANVILKAASKSSGQFEWKPDVRAHYASPNLYNGSASYSGKHGPIDYTLSLKNQAGRGAFGGPIRIFDPAGNLTERRHEVLRAQSDEPTLSTKFGLDGPGSSVGNLTLAYTRYWRPADISDRRTPIDGDKLRRNTRQELDGWSYDVNADYEFALGPGRLKLIGVREFEHQPVLVTQVTSFDSGAGDQGIRFSRDSRIGETIGRLEYGWKTGSNDWRVTLERACRLAQADAFVRDLPDGYDTLVGERGASLSGGQRQRLALARALVRRPRLLVLDDATSSVDPSVEAAILGGLRDADLPTTLVVVAYRRATIGLADEVVFLDGGGVRARGTHAALLARLPAYAALVSAYETEGAVPAEADR